MLKNKDLELMIEIMNIKLSGMYELNYDGICLNLKKKDIEFCIYVSSDVHDVFERLLAIDSYITGIAELNERVDLNERKNNMKHFTHYQIAKLTNTQRKAELFQMTEDCIYISQKNHCDINAHERIYFVRESLANYYDHNPVTIYDFLQMQTKLETLFDLMSCGLVREQKHEEN